MGWLQTTFWSCSLPDCLRTLLCYLLSGVAVVLVCGTSWSQPRWWQPHASTAGQWQLQLQDDLSIIDGVQVYAVDAEVSRESLQRAKSTGAKIMCYISAGSVENWREDYRQFPAEVIGKAYEGWPGEWWLDIRQIDLLAPIMRARIDRCRDKGFDVLDPDNINGYENDTGFELTPADSIRYLRWLASEAHQRGMAISLKNSEALLPQVSDVVDMMQSESCYYYGNCERVREMVLSGKPVFAVEYAELMSQERFLTGACPLAKSYGFSMIYRDTNLRAGSTYLACP